MENIATNIELLYEKAKDYTETSVALLRLNAIDKSAEVMSSLASRLALIMIVAMFTLFINIGLSLWLGKLLNEYYLGFFIMSGFYLLLAIFIYFTREKFIKKPISNIVIKELLKQKREKPASENN